MLHFSPSKNKKRFWNVVCHQGWNVAAGKRQCITTMTTLWVPLREKQQSVCLFVCLFVFCSTILHWKRRWKSGYNSPWSSKRTIRMKTDIVHLSAVPFLQNLHKQNCQQQTTLFTQQNCQQQTTIITQQNCQQQTKNIYTTKLSTTN